MVCSQYGVLPSRSLTTSFTHNAGGCIHGKRLPNSRLGLSDSGDHLTQTLPMFRNRDGMIARAEYSWMMLNGHLGIQDHSRITTHNFWRTLRSSKICRRFRTFWTQLQHWDSHHQSTNQYHLSGFNSGIIVPRRMDKPLTILETTNQNSFNTSNSIALVCSNMFKLQTSFFTSLNKLCLAVPTSEFGGVWCSKAQSGAAALRNCISAGFAARRPFLHSLSRTAEGMAWAWRHGRGLFWKWPIRLGQSWRNAEVVGQL